MTVEGKTGYLHSPKVSPQDIYSLHRENSNFTVEIAMKFQWVTPLWPTGQGEHH